MADKIVMENEGSLAEVAYHMAKDLWAKAHGSSVPTADEQLEFLRLVCWCSNALRGKGAYLPKE